MIAIIPARGGSKGLPGKNIKDLGGKPLIQWTIDAALSAINIDKVILSTDDEEIAEICRHTGIDIPFMRPKELAQDDSLAIDNYLYTMNRLSFEYGYEKDEFAVLLPTVPLRNSYDIDTSIDLFYKNKANTVISCTELGHPADWIMSIDKNGKLETDSSLDSRKIVNRQSLEKKYIPNGGVYIFKYSSLKENYSYYSDLTYTHIMPPERSIDIDTDFDFLIAEFYLSKVI